MKNGGDRAVKKMVCFVLALCVLVYGMIAFAEEQKAFFDSVGDGLTNAWGAVSGAVNDGANAVGEAAGAAWSAAGGAAEDTWNAVSGAAEDTWNQASETGNAVGEWVSEAADTVGNIAADAWHWTVETATGTWNDIEDFFAPPSTDGNPKILPEPELPAGTQKMYLGYKVQKTGLNNGYSGEKSIGHDDMHYGINLGKFYVSGFTSALSPDNENFVFLKTVGDNIELHFELAQDIDMLGGDTLVTINSDDGGYDKYFGIPPTYFGRGTLIVRHTDYQNNAGEPQIYTDFLAAKASGEADTVISINEEGDYEVALDYEIKRDRRLLGTKMTSTDYGDYKIFFRFSVRNGNCMVFPFDLVTGEELRNSAFTENGFYLDLAYSRYLDIVVKHSVLTEGASGLIEDVRFNRPARDGEQYVQEGIYTITVQNRYTNEETVKRLYVGSDERLKTYIAEGLTVEQILNKMN